MVRILEGRGYRCRQATDGLSALEALASEGYALLISDIMMPGMSGLQLLTKAKQAQPGLAAIMLTAMDNPETALEALALGAYGYLIKPFQPNEAPE